MQTILANPGKKSGCKPSDFSCVFSNSYIFAPTAQKAYSNDRAVNVSVFSVPTGTSELFWILNEATRANFPINLADRAVTDSR